MRQIHFKWKYLLASILLANNIACSNDDLAQMGNRLEQEGGTRTAEMVTQTITLETEGTLRTKLSETMGDAKVSTLEKLIVSGPFTSTDMQFVRDSLTGLKILDMEFAQIKMSEEVYNTGAWEKSYFKDNEICDYMFYHMDYLREIILPITVTAIGKYAFYDCDSLRSVSLPDYIETIEERTFNSCEFLSSISLPKMLKKIGDSAFADCQGLEFVTIPDSLKTIEYNAFYNCDKLKELVIPNTVSSLNICNCAFYGCDSLENIQMLGGVETIGNQSFEYCISVKKIIIPETLKTIGEYAFYNCNQLKDLIIPATVSSLTIGNNAFYNCTSLENVQMHGRVLTIGKSAFEYCNALKKLVIPESVKEIGDWAFHNCRKMQSLTIPASVNSVGSYFVSNCPELSTLVWNSESLDVPYSYNVSNCILFVNTDQIAIADINNWKSIVINGFAETTIKLEDGNYDTEYSNGKEFTAKKIVYNRYFGDTTYPGGSSGWQTIVLPFTPDSIYHESKGQIAPFNSGIDGAKPFWLRELTSEGFVDVTKIEANKPYIIAMPNHGDYMEEYCLNGNITFVARDSVFRVTPDILEASVGPDFELHPTYKYVKRSTDVFNLGTVWNYYEEEGMRYSKSFFIKNKNDVTKFNAYVTTLGGGRSSRSMFDLDTRSKETRAAWMPNKTGIPQIGDM